MHSIYILRLFEDGGRDAAAEGLGEFVEPANLAAGELKGARGHAGMRFFEGKPTGEVLGQLAHPDGVGDGGVDLRPGTLHLHQLRRLSESFAGYLLRSTRDRNVERLSVGAQVDHGGVVARVPVPDPAPRRGTRP